VLEWSYFGALIFSICGLLLFDWRWKFVFFNDARRAALTIASGMAIFIIWDLLGIYLGIFFSGRSPFALPFMLVPEFPLEEILFLFLFCYITLLLYEGIQRGYRHLSSTQR